MNSLRWKLASAPARRSLVSRGVRGTQPRFAKFSSESQKTTVSVAAISWGALVSFAGFRACNLFETFERYQEYMETNNPAALHRSVHRMQIPGLADKYFYSLASHATSLLAFTIFTWGRVPIRYWATTALALNALQAVGLPRDPTVKPTNDGTLLFELGGRDTDDKDNSTLVSLGSVTVEDKTKAHPHGRTSNTSNRTSWRGSTGPKIFLQEDTLPVLKSKLRKLGLPVHGTKEDLARRLYEADGTLATGESVNVDSLAEIHGLDGKTPLDADLGLPSDWTWAKLNGWKAVVLTELPSDVKKPVYNEVGENIYDCFVVRIEYIDARKQVRTVNGVMYRKNLRATSLGSSA